MPSNHPVRRLWDFDGASDALSEARFEFHHLASDIRTLSEVEGVESLLKSMRDDVDNYDDYRYELRLAASFARDQSQDVVKLAGKRKGPDIQVVAGGEMHGIACYRGKTLTPAVLGFEDEIRDTVFRLAVAQHGLHPSIGQSIVTELVLPRFPLDPSHLDLAARLFEELWSPAGLNRGEIEQDGVKVARCFETKPAVEDSWEARLRFLVPVPARERFRLTNHVRAKLDSESHSWARDFGGQAVFAMEESDFCLGIARERVEELLMTGGGQSFGSMLTTVAFFGDATTKGRFRFEEINWIHQPSQAPTPELRLETFSDNLENYERDHLVGFLNPRHATYEWVIAGAERGCGIALQVAPLSLERRMSRVPIPDDTPISGRALRPQIDQLVHRLRPTGGVGPLPEETARLLRASLAAARRTAD